VELERRLRAFTPWPGGSFTTDAGVVKVHQAKVAQGIGAPGTVLSVSTEGIELACGEGSLVITMLQPEGKRAMSARDYLSGRSVPVGACWPKES